MRKLIVVFALSVLPSLAGAAESAAAAPFREIVTRWATEDQRYIEQWWEANLDADAKPERVAVLCDVSGQDKQGFFIIEKDAAHRWEITFDVDSKTSYCTSGAPKTPPTLEVRTTPSIELRQNRRDGHTSTFIALRINQPVIVREEEANDADKKPVVKDWDLAIKKRQEKNYQVPEHTKAINR